MSKAEGRWGERERHEYAALLAVKMEEGVREQKDVGGLWKLERARRPILPPGGMHPCRPIVDTDLQTRDKCEFVPPPSL